MPGETDPAVLLASMQPVLYEGTYVFCTTDALPAGVEPLGLFREEEGLTLILPRAAADAAGLRYTGVFRRITLSVHSSLEAVGFLAAVTGVLAEHGIGVNPIAGYYHDHLFVPAACAEEAMAVLRALAARARTAGQGGGG
jgi:hypothetical protein